MKKEDGNGGKIKIDAPKAYAKKEYRRVFRRRGREIIRREMDKLHEQN